MKPLTGIFTPLITPIQEDESPDVGSLEGLVRWQLENGVSGIWAMGTTAEFASFDEDERAAVVETIVHASAGAPVIANISDASTRLTIRHAVRAQSAGAIAVAATPPYYYPHSQDELLQHYRAIKAAVELPVFMYNIPQTVRTRIELGTAQILAAEGTVSGIKDSQNDLEWFRQHALFVSAERISYSLLAGTRALIDAAVVAGASGAVPSMANAFPDLCVTAFDAAMNKDFAASARAEARIIEAEQAASIARAGSRNAAVIGLIKAVLWERGIIASPALTSPLRTLTAGEQAAINDRINAMFEPRTRH